MNLKIYTASKISDADTWHSLKEDWSEITFTARWPFLHTGHIPDEGVFAKVFWQHDMEDITEAHGVLLWTEHASEKPNNIPWSHLRGALVEAGMAIAQGKFVILVGDHPDYGTWRYHPQCYIVPDFETARTLLKCLAIGELA